MAYKKYIKRGGKIYGPYLYHSRRINGKVISEYHGTDNKSNLKYIWIFIGISLLIAFSYFLSNSFQSTGHSILNLDVNYQEGEYLDGKLNFFIHEGEFVPADSKIILNNNGNIYEYSLRDLILEEVTKGDFFVINTSVLGEGEGYGLIGEKEIYPKISFILLLDFPGKNFTESLEVEILGEVSENESFFYSLNDNETIELKPKSLKTLSGDILDDNLINIEVNGRDVIITTDYSETIPGYGEDYLGDETKELNINLSHLDVLFDKGFLNISIAYFGEEIVSVGTILEEGKISVSEEIFEESFDESKENFENIPKNDSEIVPSENSSAEYIALNKIELTLEERKILEEQFGNVSLIVKKATSKKGYLTVRYQIGNYWVEYTYDESINAETLDFFMTSDRIKWLKDIANSLSYSEDLEKEVILSDEYKFD